MSDLLHKLLWEPNLLDSGRKPNELVEVDWSLSITRGLKFDTLLDGNPDIVGGKPLTLNNNATWQVGQAGKCLNCITSDDWAGIPDHPDFEVANNNNGFTWIFLAELPNIHTNTDRTLIGRESEVSGNRSIRINKKKNNIDEFEFITATSSGTWGTSNYTFPIGITYDKPYFLAGKVDDRSGSPVKNLFLDGQKSSDMANAFNEYPDYAQEWRLGIGGTANDYVGNIYRAIFFNRPLEDEEIEEIRRNPNLYLKPSAELGFPSIGAVGPVTIERTLSDIIAAPSDLVSIEALYYRALLDSVDAIDSIIREIQGFAFNRVLSDSLDVSDLTIVESLKYRSLLEAISISDNLPIEAIKYRALLDTLNPELILNGTFDTDTVWTKGAAWTIAGGMASKVIGGDSLLYQDVLVEGDIVEITYTVLNYTSGTISCFAGFGALGITRSANGTYTETLTVTAPNAIRAGVNGSSGSVLDIDNFSVRSLKGGVSDGLVNEALLYRALLESITANDSLLVEALHYRALIDSIDALDSLSRSVFGGLVIERTLSDSVDVTDLDERYIIALRALVESLTTTDLIGRDTELFRLLQDNIEIADAIIRTITLGGVTIIERTLQDNINVNDLLNRSLELYRRFAETTDVSDELRVQEEIFRKLFSAIDTTDALIRSVFAGLVIERNLSDSVNITDSLFRTTMLVRLLHEDITTYDQLIRTLTFASTAIGFIVMALDEEPIEMDIKIRDILADVKTFH
jgi:hypothetical protein